MEKILPTHMVTSHDRRIKDPPSKKVCGAKIPRDLLDYTCGGRSETLCEVN